MQLDPRRGALCVIQATITTPSGDAEFASLSMPAAPFGTPAWQLPTVASYLHALQDLKQAPSATSFTAHLRKRARAAIPSPGADYPYAALHDERITCLISLVMTPGRSTAWPHVSLALMQQEAGRPRCSWSSLEYERGTLAVLRRTALETAAERDRLADQVRQGTHPDAGDLQRLAERVTHWSRGVYDMARAAHTAARAADVRHALRGT